MADPMAAVLSDMVVMGQGTGDYWSPLTPCVEYIDRATSLYRPALH